MNLLSSNRKRIFFPNLKILLPIVLLSVIGIISLLSTVILPSGGFGELEIVSKQVIFVIIGLILYLLLSVVDLSYLKHWQVILIIYVFTLLLLLATLFFAPTINNVKRWLVIGGVQIQPSEIAKIVVIFLTAIILSKKDTYNEWLLFFISFLLTIPFVILVYIEPHGSMALLILLIWFFMSFLGLSNPLRNSIILVISSCISGAFLLNSVTSNSSWFFLLVPGIILAIFSFYSNKPWKNLVVISVLVGLFVGIVSSTVWGKVLKEYQKDRVVAFFNPTETEDDIGFNVNQSRIAIGSGRIVGKGFGNGTQSKRNFLPEHQTDFMFASFAEEFGLVGSLFLIFLYGFLIIVCFSVAIDSTYDTMFTLIALGVGIKILFEVFVNIGTNTGAIPATGIPLPLMSAGGSITVMTFICLGLVQNISNLVSKSNKDKSREIVDFFEN